MGDPVNGGDGSGCGFGRDSHPEDAGVEPTSSSESVPRPDPVTATDSGRDQRDSLCYLRGLQLRFAHRPNAQSPADDKVERALGPRRKQLNPHIVQATHRDLGDGVHHGGVQTRILGAKRP